MQGIEDGCVYRIAFCIHNKALPLKYISPLSDTIYAVFVNGEECVLRVIAVVSNITS